MPTLHEQERKASTPALLYSKWVTEGSDDLREAHVSVCAHAANHDTIHMPLAKIVGAIAKGILVLPGDRPVVDLKDEQAAIVTLYDKGGQEAEALNKVMLRNILKDRKIEAEPDEVEVVTRQPSANAKTYLYAEIKHAGTTYKLPDGFVYRNPKAEGKRLASDRKKRLPGVCSAGCFQPQRQAQDLVRVTGLYPLDLDGIDDMAAVSAKIRTDPTVFLESLSITGSGLCAVVRGPVALTPSRYSATYKAIAAAKGKEWGIVIDVVDPATSDVCRLRFLSSDEELYVNWDAEALDVDVPERAEPQPAPRPASRARRRMCNPASLDTPSPSRIAQESEHGQVSAELLRELLAVIPTDNLQTWLTVTGAVKLWGENAAQQALSYEIASDWAKKSDKYDEEVQQKTWDSLNRGNGEQVATVGSLFHLAKQHGWTGQPPINEDEIIINALAEMGILEYERVRQKSAAKLNLTVTGLDRVVKQALAAKRAKRVAALPDGTKDTRPEWEVPTESMTAPAKELYTIMGAAQDLVAEQGRLPRFFLRQKALVEVSVDCALPSAEAVVGATGPGIVPVSIDRLPRVVEQYVRPFHLTEKGGKCFTILNQWQCRTLLKCQDELNRLPVLRVLANAPVITADGENPRIIRGYDAATGTLVMGGSVEMDMSLDGAVFLLNAVLDEFQWASEADHSRAIASYLTPAMVNGSLMNGRPPVDVSEADLSRTGKGLRQDLIALSYREHFTEIAQNDRGSLEDKFDGVLIHGGTWPRIDNYRDTFDSPKIESFLTQDTYAARSAYYRSNGT